jgi:imidazolonepropionase-like amidohydrolase
VGSGRQALTLRALVLLATLVPAAIAAQTIAITNATVYPVSGPKLDGATVLIRDGRIAAVGKVVVIPATARLVDGTGKVVTPGLLHVQGALGLGVGRALAEETDEEYTAIGGTTDGEHEGEVSPAFNVLAAIDPNAVAIPVARMGGVTSALTMPTSGLVAGQAVMIHLAGQHTADMVLLSPAAMVADLGDASRTAGGGSRAGALARLRTLFTDAATLRRRRADYDQNRIGPLSAPADQLEALYPVLDGQLPLYVNANRQSDIENALALAADFRLRLILRRGAETWRVAARIARAGVPVVIDTRDNIPSFDGLQARSDNAALLREAGVTVILAGQDPGGQMNLRFEAGQAVRNGMKWDDALEAITAAPARAFGLADQLGTLEPGKVADVVMWSGDPFEFSTAAELVFIDGAEVSLKSRMTELRDRYKTLPPAY